MYGSWLEELVVLGGDCELLISKSAREQNESL